MKQKDLEDLVRISSTLIQIDLIKALGDLRNRVKDFIALRELDQRIEEELSDLIFDLSYFLEETGERGYPGTDTLVSYLIGFQGNLLSLVDRERGEEVKDTSSLDSLKK